MPKVKMKINARVKGGAVTKTHLHTGMNLYMRGQKPTKNLSPNAVNNVESMNLVQAIKKYGVKDKKK